MRWCETLADNAGHDAQDVVIAMEVRRTLWCRMSTHRLTNAVLLMTAVTCPLEVLQRQKVCVADNTEMLKFYAN